jgi:hypothetical protein
MKSTLLTEKIPHIFLNTDVLGMTIATEEKEKNTQRSHLEMLLSCPKMLATLPSRRHCKDACQASLAIEPTGGSGLITRQIQFFDAEFRE